MDWSSVIALTIIELGFLTDCFLAFSKYCMRGAVFVYVAVDRWYTQTWAMTQRSPVLRFRPAVYTACRVVIYVVCSAVGRYVSPSVNGFLARSCRDNTPGGRLGRCLMNNTGGRVQYAPSRYVWPG